MAGIGNTSGIFTGQVDPLIEILMEKEKAAQEHHKRIYNGDLARQPGSEVERVNQAYRDSQAERDRKIDALIEAHAASKGNK